MSRMKIEELVQLEAEQRLDELRSVRNELAMLHRTIMDMQTKSTTSEQMISLLVSEIRDLKKIVSSKGTAVVKESSCNTDNFETIDASTDTGITLLNASTMTRKLQTEHVSVAAAPTQVDVGLETDGVETCDAVVDMGITTVDVCTMFIPSSRDIEVSASPRMKNVSTTTVVGVRPKPTAKSNVEVEKQQPPLLPKNKTHSNIPTKFASVKNSPCAAEFSSKEPGQRKGGNIDTHASGGQTSRKRKVTEEIAVVPKKTHKEEQRMKILEKIRTFERFIAKVKRRKFGGQVGGSPTGEQCLFCGRDDHFNDNCPIMRSATARLEYAQKLQICLMCLSDSCSSGPSCPGRNIPCDYCVAMGVANSNTHHSSFCFRPERYEEFKKQLDDLHAKLRELDHQ